MSEIVWKERTDWPNPPYWWQAQVGDILLVARPLRSSDRWDYRVQFYGRTKMAFGGEMDYASADEAKRACVARFEAIHREVDLPGLNGASDA